MPGTRGWAYAGERKCELCGESATREMAAYYRTERASRDGIILEHRAAMSEIESLQCRLDRAHQMLRDTIHTPPDAPFWTELHDYLNGLDSVVEKQDQ